MISKIQKNQYFSSFEGDFKVSRNIEMNYLNGSGYEQLYPRTNMSNISDWNSYVYSKAQVDGNISSVNNSLSVQIEEITKKVNQGISGINPWISFKDSIINFSGTSEIKYVDKTIISNFLNPDEDCYVLISIDGTADFVSGEMENGRHTFVLEVGSTFSKWRVFSKNYAPGTVNDFPIKIKINEFICLSIIGSNQYGEIKYLTPLNVERAGGGNNVITTVPFDIASSNLINMQIDSGKVGREEFSWNYDIDVHLKVYKRPGILSH